MVEVAAKFDELRDAHQALVEAAREIDRMRGLPIYEAIAGCPIFADNSGGENPHTFWVRRMRQADLLQA